MFFSFVIRKQKKKNDISIPRDASSFCRIMCSLVNLTLWWASTQVEQRYSTQFTQNPVASVLSSQVIHSYSQVDETNMSGWYSFVKMMSNYVSQLKQIRQPPYDNAFCH